MDVNNKRVLVVGLGKSGVASALFLKSKGARVTVSVLVRAPQIFCARRTSTGSMSQVFLTAAIRMILTRVRMEMETPPPFHRRDNWTKGVNGALGAV